MILGLENVAVAAALHLPSSTRLEQAATSPIVTEAAQVPDRWRPFQRCVVARESHGNPHAANRYSSARGKYQFLRAWQRPLAGMVADRLQSRGMTKRQAAAIKVTLRRTSIDRWPENFQDVGFAAVIAKGGWRAWYQPGSFCNGYAR